MLPNVDGHLLLVNEDPDSAIGRAYQQLNGTNNIYMAFPPTQTLANESAQNQDNSQVQPNAQQQSGGASSSNNEQNQQDQDGQGQEPRKQREDDPFSILNDEGIVQNLDAGNSNRNLRMTGSWHGIGTDVKLIRIRT